MTNHYCTDVMKTGEEYKRIQKEMDASLMYVIASPERREWAWQSYLTFKQEIAILIEHSASSVLLFEYDVDLLAMTVRTQKEMDTKLAEWEGIQK
jgi:hypothetical protein